MIDRKIIAQNISNLSDARYFAAWGIDYIAFNTIKDSPYYLSMEDITEIKNWVEGPRCLLETNALEFTDLADGYILSNIYQSMPISKEAFYRIGMTDLQKGVPQSRYILSLNASELQELKNLDPSLYGQSDMYVDIQNLALESFSEWPEWGLVVQGSEEEKVGLKSFDELDKLYDLLMD